MEVSVHLSDIQQEIIDEAIKSGRYQSRSEVIQAGLDKIKKELATLKLKAELIKGEKSGIIKDFKMESLIESLHKSAAVK